MEKQIITFSANEQCLQKTGGVDCYASNTVAYIEAHFDLGTNWSGYDSVRAVWSNDNNMTVISTVLDSNGVCVVPFEVLKTKGVVKVNLVGSISVSDVLTDRLTTFPCEAVKVTAKAKIEGSETQPITPSQFEQFVAAVISEVEKVTGMAAQAETLPAGSQATARYENGILYLGIPQGIQGERGETGADGNGIASVVYNADYSLTLVFDNGERFTTPPIRGERGPAGADGRDGTNGRDGADGVTPSLSVGTVTTLPSTEDAYVTRTGTDENPVFDFGIPQGPKGDKGDTGEVSQAEFDEAVSDLKSELSDIGVEENTTVVPAPISVGYTINGSGAIVSSAGNYYIYKASVTVGKTYLVTAKNHWSAPFYAYYDSNMDLVEKGTSSEVGATVTSIEDEETIAPATASYLVTTSVNESIDEPVKEKDGYILPRLDEVISDVKGIVGNKAGIATKTATSLTVTVGKLKVIVNKYNDATIRAYDLWRTNNAYIKSGGGFTRLWYNSDSDGVVKIKDEDDFIGGYHGDETQTAFHLFVDGVAYAENDTFTELGFNELVLYCASDVYHCNTSETPDVVAFKRNKIITFNKDGYSVLNYWVAQEALTLIRAYMGMLSVERYTDSNYTDYLITGYHTNHDFAYMDADTGKGAQNDITEVLFNTIYGDVGIKISDIKTPHNYYGDVTNYNSAYDKRLKAYLAPINSNAGASLSVGAVIKAKSTIFVR